MLENKIMKKLNNPYAKALDGLVLNDPVAAFFEKIIIFWSLVQKIFLLYSFQKNSFSFRVRKIVFSIADMVLFIVFSEEVISLTQD